MNTAKPTRNAEIEFLRFLFCIVVFLSHARELLLPPPPGTLTDNSITLFAKGGLAVEFFFLLSGYFTMSFIDRHQNGSFRTSAFIFRKIKGFYPELCASLLIATAVVLWAWGTESFGVKLLQTLTGSGMLLKMTGLSCGCHDMNGPTWYLSSMIIGLIIVYPLLRKFGVTPLLVLTAICTCGYLCIDNGTLTHPYNWMGFTYAGNLRAVAELILGAAVYKAAGYLSACRLRPLTRFLLMLLKYACLLFFLYTAWEPRWNTDGVTLCALWVMLVIIFADICPDRRLYDVRLSYIAGAFSLPLYLSHRVFTWYLREIFPTDGLSDTALITLCFLCSLIAAALTYCTARFIRRKVCLFGRT